MWVEFHAQIKGRQEVDWQMGMESKRPGRQLTFWVVKAAYRVLLLGVKHPSSILMS